jgi:hypothetical protein
VGVELAGEAQLLELRRLKFVGVAIFGGTPVSGGQFAAGHLGFHDDLIQEVARREVCRCFLVIMGELAERLKHLGELGGHRLVRDTCDHRVVVLMRRSDADERFAALEAAPADDLGDAVLAAVDVPVMAGHPAVAVAGLEQGGVVAEQVGEDLVDRRHR